MKTKRKTWRSVDNALEYYNLKQARKAPKSEFSKPRWGGVDSNLLQYNDLNTLCKDPRPEVYETSPELWAFMSANGWIHDEESSR